jgi:phosphatidylglycerophosphatase A
MEFALFAILGLGGGELILMFAVILILFGAKHWTRHLGDLRDSILEAFTTHGKTREVLSGDLNAELKRESKWNLRLWVAQGLGCGNIPGAPGTFGSLLGVVWFALLLWPRSPILFAMGTAAGIALSVWLCGLAEKELGQKDPSSVVLDEIAALPLCFAAWLGVYFEKHQALPGPEYFFRQETWLLTAGTFVLFRIFDILKPWPLRQSQALPRGWGITADDLLAATYTAIITGVAAAKLLSWP